jgi:alanine-synthesizing transaminase
MEEFSRIQRLPPYVFNITGEMKVSARRRGEDIIDFGMGNPDGATPKHIVDKLVEAAMKPQTHRYSVSRGLPRLRKAICNWYKTRYNVDLNPDTEAIVTIGSKEGDSRLARHRARPQSQLPHPHLRPGHRRRTRRQRPRP